MNQNFPPDNEQRNLSNILDAVDALIYVADMETYELIFMNKYGRDIWGEPEGKSCWKVLQLDQAGRCDFCTNDKLLGKDGRPTDVYIWEFQNTVDGRWYQCRDQAIEWIDGRIVRIEIATDITDLKEAENALKQEKIKAEALARIDVLTGIRNRRAIFEEGRQTLNLARRFKHQTSVVSMDIDNFKKVNDKYGHFSGDMVLVSFSKLIGRTIRKIDLFGRIGGEEFVLILPETELMAAVELVDKLREKIAALVVDDGDNEIAITCSFGVATNSTGTESLEEVLSEADKTLYRAKGKGRNRVEYKPENNGVDPKAKI